MKMWQFALLFGGIVVLNIQILNLASRTEGVYFNSEAAIGNTRLILGKLGN